MTVGFHGVMLKTVKLRGRRYTTPEWVEEFNAETREFGGSVEWAAEQSLAPFTQFKELQR